MIEASSDTKVQRKAQIWVATFQPSSELSLLLFKMRPERGGFWQPITGGVEDGENFLEGAARELREESGFPCEEKDLFDLEYEYEFLGSWGPALERAFLYLCKEQLEPHIDEREHIAAEWVSYSEAITRITFPDQRRVLEKVQHTLERAGQQKSLVPTD